MSGARRRRPRTTAASSSPALRPASPARQLALRALGRIDDDGAYANLVLPSMLGQSALSDMDRRFVTDLVYGTTRMRRACDALVDRFLASPPDAVTRRVLRLGAYQLVYAGVPPHAAVGETVSLAPRRTRGLVNAVLRRVASHPLDEMTWPSDSARLSYPDWIVDTYRAEVGDEAEAALARMNAAPTVTTRDDGYVQDESSQWVAAAVEARPGERVLDLCAAPGGKATALAAAGALVTANDRNVGRIRLVTENVARLRLDDRVDVIVADGTTPPLRDGSFAAVLLDAPCSGLGALRRRPDARWRIEPRDVAELAELQGRLLSQAAALVAPGGRLVYSVCTITAAESIDHLVPAGFAVDATPPPIGVWRQFGHGWRVLPQDADTDAMVLVRYRRST